MSTATVTSKGQITLPVNIRRALGIERGDRLAFSIRGDKVEVERAPDFLALAGSIKIPAELSGLEWAEVRRRTDEIRSAEYSKKHGG